MKLTIAAVVIGLLSPSLVPPAAGSQEPKTSVREIVTVDGVIDRIDRSQRILTLRRTDGFVHSVYVAPEIRLFDDLKTGDRITVRLRESVIVAVRPDLKPAVPTDTTAAASKGRGPGEAGVLQQLKAVVTIEAVDRQQKTVTYKTADNRRVIRAVLDPKLLDGLEPGDTVEITYVRERAIDLQRKP